jgi:SAM-dependent methyltransferase
MKRHPLPLSKCLDPEDYTWLLPEKDLLEQHQATIGQHPHRLWEYCMALRAIAEWRDAQAQADGGEDRPLHIADVGGAGSRFAATLTERAATVSLIDPALTLSGLQGGITCFPVDLWQYAATYAHGAFDGVTALSVLEHVPDEEIRRFLRAARMVLRPGGLLFLTMDCWNCTGPDTAHFHWMRERIYNPDLIRALQQSLRELGFASFGKGDWSYPGSYVYDYSFASLAMVKR